MCTAFIATLNEFVKSLKDRNLEETEEHEVPITPTLLFDTNYGKRHDIMMHFVEMMSRGLIVCTEKKLFEFLSTTTNLGSYDSIRQLYYRCQREYVRK